MPVTVVLVAGVGAAVVLGASGSLRQKAGQAGCIAQAGTRGGCTAARAVGSVFSLAVSGDGKNVYAAANGSNAVAVFDRARRSGTLRQKRSPLGCIALQPPRSFGSGGVLLDGCGRARSLFGPVSVAVSPDDRNVYAIGHGVVIFDRERTTGAIRQKRGHAGCVSEDGTRGDCTDGRALDAANKVTISPDGKNAYVTFRTGLAIFDRDPVGGALTQKPGQAGCISMDGGAGGAFADSIAPGSCATATAIAGAITAAVSPDGKNVYVAGSYGDALVILDREPITGALTAKPGTAGCVTEDGTDGLDEFSPYPPDAKVCADGQALREAESVAVSPDGNNVYVAAGGSDAIAVFDRDLVDGSVTQKPGRGGCVSETGTRGACANARALRDPNMVTISPDGAQVYVAAFTSGAISIFGRRLGGALKQDHGRSGCISQTGTHGACRKARVLQSPASIAISPDAKHLYTAPGLGNTITILDRR